MTNQKTSKNNGLTIVLILLLLASLGLNFYQFLEVKNVGNVVENQLVKIDSISLRSHELEIEFNRSIEELEQYKGENAQLDSLLSEANVKLEAQRKEIQQLINTRADYQVVKERIKAMRSEMQEYIAEIERLKEENKQLKYENTKLAVALDQTKEKNTQLQTKVEKASKLIVTNSVISSINLVGKKEKETNKAKKVEKFNISFTIGENPIAKMGKQDVYIRIINPEGYLLADGGNDIQKFIGENGKEVPYSKSISIDYDGQKMTKSLSWSQEGFNPGHYKIEIYIDGYFAGANNIDLY